MKPETIVTILGTGAWGTALAAVMARKGHATTIWGRSQETCNEINSAHTNEKYLPGITLPKEITATSSLEEALEDAEIILVVTPAQTIAEMAERIAPFVKSDAELVLCAKGIDRQTGLLPAQSLEKHLPGARLSALSGPSFASDVANNLPTAVTLAADDISRAENIAARLSDPAFRVYANDDLYGTELGGALKNVIAVAVGVCRGMKLGASAEAALIARGFAELSRLAQKTGARQQTLAGLSGLGDLVLTCSSPQSRNFSYGMHLGDGTGVAGLPLAEGAFTAAIANRIAIENAIECPIIAMVAKLVEGTINAPDALQQLLARPLKQETR